MAKQRKNKNVRDNKTIKDGVQKVQKEEIQSSSETDVSEETSQDVSQSVVSLKPEEKIEEKPIVVSEPAVVEKPVAPPPKAEEKKPELPKEEPKLELKLEPIKPEEKIEEKPIVASKPAVVEKPVSVSPPKAEEKKPEPPKEEPKLELKLEPIKPEEKIEEKPIVAPKPAVVEKPVSVSPPKAEEKKPEPPKEEPKLELKLEPIKPEEKIEEKPVVASKPAVVEKPVSVSPPKAEEKKPELPKEEPKPVNKESTSHRSYLVYGVIVVSLLVVLVLGIKFFLPTKEPSQPPAIVEETPKAVEKVAPNFSVISEKFLKIRNSFYEAEIEPSLAQGVNKDIASFVKEINSFSSEKLNFKEQVEKNYFLMNLHYYSSAISSDNPTKIENADKSLKSAEELATLLKDIEEKTKEITKEEKSAEKEETETLSVDPKDNLLETQNWIKEENIQEKISFYTALNLSLKKIAGADIKRKDVIDVLKKIPKKFMKNEDGENLYNHPIILQAVKKDKTIKKNIKKDK